MPNMRNDVDSQNKDRTYLSSCSSEGVEYGLYDNVKVFGGAYTEPYIGKISKLWEEKESGTRKVLVRWFLRHKEVKPHVDENPKELFLAFGEGKGVTNENDLDVIVGKCKVVCTSKDPRNKRPSANDIEDADYFFSHVYDVDLEHTCPVERVVDKLGFNAIFNKQEWVTARIKSEKKADEQQTNQEIKDDVNLKHEVQLIGSSLPESKKRPRDADSSSQKKNLGNQAGLKKGHLSFDEASKKQKIKVSDGKASGSKESLKKDGANSVSNMKEVLQSNNQCIKNETVSKLLSAMQGLNSGDVLLSKTQITDVQKPSEGAGLSSREAEREEENSSESPQPFAAPESTDSKKTSMPEKISSVKETLPLLNSAIEECAVLESLKNKNILKEVDDKANNLDEIVESKTNTVPKNIQTLENMDVVKPAENDLGFMGEESDSRQFTKTIEVSGPDIMLKAEAKRRQQADREAGISGREKTDSRKLNFKPMPELESRSNITKKMKIATGVEAEKRPMSTVEMVKAIEKRKIFKELPWEENLQQGIPYGKVLLLQNFDPLVTSADVRDMLKSTFQGLSDARVLPQETICPSGQALAIFETKLLADCALEAMEMKCLMVTDKKRPVIASRVKESSSQFRFPGHLALEKLKLGRNILSEDYKRAVSTSHCSQPNTIEFEMAMEWRQLQEITQNCRVELFKKQRKEINDFRSGGDNKALRSKAEGV